MFISEKQGFSVFGTLFGKNTVIYLPVTAMEVGELVKYFLKIIYLCV